MTIRPTYVLATLGFGLLSITGISSAEDLGQRGNSFALDPDGREAMKSVIRRKKASGELADFWRAARQKAIESVKHPAPLGVRSDYRSHTEVLPVRFVLPVDYHDQAGRVIAAKGTVIEPLAIQSLRTGLAFIDGRDPKQVAYAIERGRSQPLKIVLIAGSAFDLRVKYQKAAWPLGRGIPFYFDQGGMIIKQLHGLYGIDVSSVPMLLQQAGKDLRLEFGIGARS